MRKKLIGTYIASKIITYVVNEGKNRSTKKERAEYLTMGETWRCYITGSKRKK